MKIHFRNKTTSRLWVAILFYNPDGCRDAGGWGSRGWWAIEPGEEAYVLKTNNRYSAYYAESDDGLVWSGHYGPVYVHQDAFEGCVDVGDNNPLTRVVGMRLVDAHVGGNHYVNLVHS